MSETTTTPVQNIGPITGSVLFYKQPEPLNPEMHGKLGVKQMDNPFGFAREGHAVPLTVGEFPLAAICGPIIFVGDDKTPLKYHIEKYDSLLGEALVWVAVPNVQAGAKTDNQIVEMMIGREYTNVFPPKTPPAPSDEPPAIDRGAIHHWDGKSW